MWGLALTVTGASPGPIPRMTPTWLARGGPEGRQPQPPPGPAATPGRETEDREGTGDEGSTTSSPRRAQAGHLHGGVSVDTRTGHRGHLAGREEGLGLRPTSAATLEPEAGDAERALLGALTTEGQAADAAPALAQPNLPTWKPQACEVGVLSPGRLKHGEGSGPAPKHLSHPCQAHRTCLECQLHLSASQPSDVSCRIRGASCRALRSYRSSWGNGGSHRGRARPRPHNRPGALDQLWGVQSTA